METIMKKNKKLYIACFFGMGLISIPLSANDFLNKSAVEHTDACVHECNKYYKEKGNLTGFNFINKYLQLADALLSNWGISAPFQNVKKEYCEKAKASLEQCYGQDSKAYGICKSSARWLSSLVTSNPDYVDLFSSCKETCSNELEKYCNK